MINGRSSASSSARRWTTSQRSSRPVSLRACPRGAVEFTDDNRFHDGRSGAKCVSPLWLLQRISRAAGARIRMLSWEISLHMSLVRLHSLDLQFSCVDTAIVSTRCRSSSLSEGSSDKTSNIASRTSSMIARIIGSISALPLRTDSFLIIDGFLDVFSSRPRSTAIAHRPHP